MNFKVLQKYFLILAILSIVLTSGCINVEVEQKISESGASQIKTVVDMSPIYSNAQQDQPTIEKALSDYCTNFMSSTDLKNPYCTPVPEKYTVIAGGEFATVDPSITFDGYTYKYELKNTREIIKNIATALKQEITPENINDLKQSVESAGLKLKFTVEMPGIVTRADYGNVVGNRVEMDFFDIYENDHIYIESQQSGITGMFLSESGTIIAGAVVAIIVIVLVIFFLKKRKKKVKTGFNRESELKKIKKGLH